MLQYRQRAWAEISLDALAHNVQAIQETLAPSTEFCAVVKADAYGHGEEYICKMLHEIGIRFYAVSSIEEALRVRKWCPDAEILILGYTSPECAPLLADQNILQAVVSVEYAKSLSSCAVPGRTVRCHIKLDTGMGRIGIRTHDESCLHELHEILSLPGLQIEGLFTHFAAADEDAPEHRQYTQNQENAIFHTVDLLAQEGISFRHVHCMNSAAVCYHPQPKSTLARAGIILYGLKPNALLPIPLDLQPVLSFRSRISHIKTVQPGDCISYGRTYTAHEPRKIAAVTVGYADGYSRLLSNRGEVLVHGVRCKITGRVCMDQMMIDISDVPEAAVGSVVTLIGTDGNDTITADDLAQIYGTIGYEVVCGISKRIPRIFMQNHQVIHEDSLI